MRTKLLALAVLPLLSLAASAATRTMIQDYTGLDCTVNTDDSTMYAEPSIDSDEVLTLASDTSVHIYGGKQFGPFVAVPSTDEEFARTWLNIKAKGKMGWIQSGLVNCGG
jgi:hypothetical protein